MMRCLPACMDAQMPHDMPCVPAHVQLSYRVWRRKLWECPIGASEEECRKFVSPSVIALIKLVAHSKSVIVCATPPRLQHPHTLSAAIIVSASLFTGLEKPILLYTVLAIMYMLSLLCQADRGSFAARLAKRFRSVLRMLSTTGVRAPANGASTSGTS